MNKVSLSEQLAAVNEVELLLFEPADLRNTGNVVDPELTAPEGSRI